MSQTKTNFVVKMPQGNPEMSIFRNFVYNYTSFIFSVSWK